MRTPYTRIPQWFFGLVPELTDPELRVMLVIYRHTLGWDRDYDNLSYSQLKEETGINSRSTLSKVLKSLEAKRLITRQTTRITAQRVQVYPLVPILPSKLVHPVDSKSTPNGPVLVHPVDSKSTPNGPVLVHPVDSQKKPPKKVFKETTNMENLTPDQEESLALIVGGGVDQETGKRLISKAWSRGRDISYIKGVLGYVAGLQDVKNPAGLVVTLIERNIDRRLNQKPQDVTKSVEGRYIYHLADFGGLELEKHEGRLEDCEICKRQERGQL